MTRLAKNWFLVCVVMASGVAFADEIVNGCWGDLSAGSSCVTDDGTAGTCVEVNGNLICQPAVAGAERSALPWIGASLAFLALCAGLAPRQTLPQRRPT